VSLPRARSTDQPDEWPVTDTFSLLCAICALSNVAMVLSGKLWQFRSGRRSAQELAFCRILQKCRNLFEATPGNPFQVGHSKTPKGKQPPPPRERARSTPAEHDSKKPTNLFLHLST
jgi:hypothetical protein